MPEISEQKQLNLLIVDDEKSAIEAVMQGVNWNHLSYTNIYTAGNVVEAQKVIQTFPVKVLLCDIEMPMGSGLDLLEWINEYYPGMVCIFMTCHADFSFAQQAVHLGSFEYILKPLDFNHLEKTLLNAAAKALQHEQTQQAYSYLEQGKKAVTRQFWRELYIGDIPSDYQSLAGYIDRNHLDIPIHGSFMPVLISPKNQNDQVSAEDRKVLGFALRNITDEVFQMEPASHDLETISEDMLLLILTLHKNTSEDSVKQCCLESCKALIDAAIKYMHLPVCCYVGKIVGIADVPQQIDLLQTMNFNNIISYQMILFAGDNFLWGQDYQWKEYLHMLDRKYPGSCAKVLEEIADSFEANNHQDKIEQDFLWQFYMGIYIVLNAFGKKKNIFLTEIIDAEVSRNLIERSKSSSAALVEWIRYIKSLVQKVERGEINESNPVDQVLDYVKEHLDNVSVEILASYVHLNSDYLNRIFKKEIGIPLNKYLIQQKMNHAMWLLRHTDWQIGEVAAAVGYYNYSSFSRTFGKSTGMTPQEYKSRQG